MSEPFNTFLSTAKTLDEVWNDNMEQIVSSKNYSAALEYLLKLDDVVLKIRKDIIRLMKKESLPGYVYLMKLKSGAYKIGLSEKPGRRTTQLWGQPEVIHTIKTDDMDRLEDYLFEKFDSKRIGGEYFFLDEEDIILIKSVTCAYYQGKLTDNIKLF